MKNIHRPKWRTIGLALIFVSFIVFPVMIGTCLTVYMLFFSHSSRQDLIFKTIFFGGALIGEIMILSLLVVLLFSIVSSYIKTSSEGLEYHRWPFKKIACTWDKVDRIASGHAIGMAYSTLLIRRRVSGQEISLGLITLGSAEYQSVPLQDFQGWPEGNLAADLKRYVPHLANIEAIKSIKGNVS